MNIGIIASQQRFNVEEPQIIFNAPVLSGVFNTDQVDLSWTMPEINTVTPDSFEVEYTDNMIDYYLLGTYAGNVFSISDTGIQPGETRTYSISAYNNEVGYTGYSNDVVITYPEPGDTTIPVITLTGGNLTIDEGVPYVEPGYSASDNVDGNITGNVIVNYGGLNTSNPAEGVYTITYNVSDAAGNNAAQKSRTVTVEAVEVPVDTTPPSAPGNVQVINITYDEARVTWSASTDNVAVRGYEVYQMVSSVWLKMSNESTDLFHDLQNIGPGIGDNPNEYTIKVRAYDTSGNFADSASVTFETWSAPGTQGNTVVTNISNTSVKIDWAGAVPGTFAVAGYNVYLDEVKLNTNLITATEYTFTNLLPGTTYTRHVESVDINGRSTGAPGTNYGQGVEFTTTGTAPTSVVSDVTYSSTFGSGQTFGYKKYIPGSYNAAVSMPLVIWLHGLGERSAGSGNPQLGRLDDYGPFWEILVNSKQYNFLMIAPQQPETIGTTNYSNWHQEVIEESLNHFKAAGYNIDLNRVYITGQSMGGGGVFTYLRYYGASIAAALAICPTSTQTSQTCGSGIKNTPLWLIHNRNDNTVNISSTYNYINNMLACSPAPAILPKATIYEGSTAHNGWQATYGETSVGTLSSDANISIPNGYNEPYPESGTGLNWWEWLQQYTL